MLELDLDPDTLLQIAADAEEKLSDFLNLFYDVKIFKPETFWENGYHYINNENLVKVEQVKSLLLEFIGYQYKRKLIWDRENPFSLAVKESLKEAKLEDVRYDPYNDSCTCGPGEACTLAACEGTPRKFNSLSDSDFAGQNNCSDYKRGCNCNCSR